MKRQKGFIPSFHIVSKSIPEAFWKAMNVVHHYGYRLRTQYDRKNPDGSFLDPEGRDARVCIEILDPYEEPRFPAVSYCEIGKYIAEIMGAKDHLVLPFNVLLEHVKTGKKLEATQWPYSYHQRLFAWPLPDGSIINQAEIQLERLAQDPITRRAIMQTGVPYIDPFLKEDLPCLREIQLRAIESSAEELVLSMTATWRSRDLFKAWPDNVIALTHLQRWLADRLAEKSGRKVRVGNYIEFNGSLHLYGQDYSDKGLAEFFKNFPHFEDFEKRCLKSEDARDLMVLPQLEQLLTEEETWHFGDEQKKIIKGLIDDLKTGKYLP